MKTNQKPNGIIVVHGKQGCGKTRNQDALAQFFDAEHIVDDISPVLFERPHMHNMEILRRKVPTTGRILLLTTAAIQHIDYVMKRHFEDRYEGAFEHDEVMSARKTGVL